MSGVPTRSMPRAEIAVSALGLGGGALGGLYASVDPADAHAAVRTAYDGGVRYFDTAPLYGHGRSEQRLGEALQGLPRDSYVLATKVGIVIEPSADDSPEAEQRYADPWLLEGRYDFGYDACLRSLEGSLARLGVDRIDVVNIHDPDEGDSALPPAERRGVDHMPAVMDGAYRALHELRDQGVIGAIGVGMNGTAPLLRFAEAGDFDTFLLAGRYTLLEQDGLDDLLPCCAERGIGLVVGGVFNSGILASGTAVDSPMHDYGPAAPAVIERVRRLEAVCADHGVPLAAAALQLPLRHPAVACVIPGMRSADEARGNLIAATYPIPDTLWDDLTDRGLVDARAARPVTTAGDAA